MSSRYSFANAFKGVVYHNAGEVLAHSRTLLRDIKQNPATHLSLRHELSRLDGHILVIAPRFYRRNVYDVEGMSRAYLRRTGRKVNRKSVNVAHSRICTVLMKLKRRGLLRPSLPGTFKLREATPAEIARHSHFMHEVLTERHWRRHLTEAEASEAAHRGLVRAINLYERGRPVENFFRQRIVAELMYEIKRKRSMRRIKVRVNVVPKESSELEKKVQKDLTRLMRLGAQSYHLAAYALLKRHGVKLREIAVHFGVKKQAIHKIVVKTERALRREHVEFRSVGRPLKGSQRRPIAQYELPL